MTGFEPRTSGIGSDRSANYAATTARGKELFSRHGLVVNVPVFIKDEPSSDLTSK